MSTTTAASTRPTPHAKRTTSRRALFVVVAMLTTFLLAFAACKSGDVGSNDVGGGNGTGTGTGGGAPTCSPGQEGCACDSPGATASCGRVHQTSGHYVTCSIGTATCVDGKWGACVGDHIVTKSLPALQLGLGGVQAQTTTVPCTNLCDPYCNSLASSSDDVDAGGIVPTGSGGVTLTPDGSVTLANDAGSCIGLQCQIATCSIAGVTTTLTGTVYDPAGQVPLPNATVYIPIFRDQNLPQFSTGVSCDTCGGSSLAALQVVQTDAKGNFTLTNVPSGKDIPVVVQLGKWRRVILLSNVTSCVPNTVTNNCTLPNKADCVLRLPRSQTDGYDPSVGAYGKADLPHIAIVTGSADPFDCLLLKAGIDPVEFGDYTSNKRIHVYEADTKPGHKMDPKYGANVNGSTLWNRLSAGNPNMQSYDVILLPCEGASVDKQGATGTNTPYRNLVNYANAGGRAFATHFSYSWLALPAGKGYVAAPDNWSGVANWSPTGTAFTSSVNTQDPMTGTVVTSFPKGQQLSEWLVNVNASTIPTKLVIHEGRQDLTTIGAGSQAWMTATDTKYPKFPDYTPLFTFNTPYNASNQCGRIVFSDFHVSANANISSSTACLSNTDCGFGAKCNGAKPGATGQCNEPCLTSSDCPNTTFACDGAVPGSCQPTTCTADSTCGTGRKCIGGECSCSADADCSSGSCSGRACTQVTCTSSAQCGAGTCAGGVCNSVACRKDADCGAGTCGGTGRFGTCAGGAVCHTNADCGPTGTCGSGTSSTIGACSTNAQACRANADCDSNTCGTGTGAVKGTCGTNGKICHAASDCDSNLCGSGTGSALGVCGKLAGTPCRVNSDCDSNSCGAGTGSTAGTCSTGAGECHANADCDSLLCGSGTGSTVGKCSTSSDECHTNAQCDSGACGTGLSGSTKGVCTTGVCTTNAQCGTGGVCNATTKRCTSGACSLDSNCGTSGGVCTGATCTTKTCAADSACGVGKLCQGATCATKACATDAACGVSKTCNGAKCSAPAACASDAACVSSKSCTGAKCGNAATCAGDVGCPVSKTCTGATCGAKSCAGDTGCPVSDVCNGAKCSRSACSNDGDCPLNVCTGATCTPPPVCGSNAECGAVGGKCTGAKCSANACNSAADCGSGAVCAGSCDTPKCATNADCESGICRNGVCGCGTDENCGIAEKCLGASAGKCARSCTTDAECAPDRCYNGQCGGCTDASDCHDNTYPATCGGIPSANYGKCSSSTPGDFPGACRQGELTAQEKALEFMFFDLTACISSDSLPPPPPPVVLPAFKAATFIEDFTAACVPGLTPLWREFDWQAKIPGDSNITFFAQSGADTSSLLPGAPLKIATATKSTALGGGQSFDVALIDTSDKGIGGTGAFNTATPRVKSSSVLRMTITLNPTSDLLEAPTLLQWKVQYDCVPNE